MTPARATHVLRVALLPPGAGPEQLDGWSLDERDLELVSGRPGYEQLEGALLELVHDGALVATARARRVTIVWPWDHEHWVALRLESRLEHALWDVLPWRDLPLGSVFYAWTHYFDPRSRGATGSVDLALHAPEWQDVERGFEPGEVVLGGGGAPS